MKIETYRALSYKIWVLVFILAGSLLLFQAIFSKLHAFIDPGSIHIFEFPSHDSDDEIERKFERDNDRKAEEGDRYKQENDVENRDLEYDKVKGPDGKWYEHA